MESEWNLSDKMWKGETGAFIGKVLLEKDVREFIKRLKEIKPLNYQGVAHKGHWTKDNVCTWMAQFMREVKEDIDKLAGEKLC